MIDKIKINSNKGCFWISEGEREANDYYGLTVTKVVFESKVGTRFNCGTYD